MLACENCKAEREDVSIYSFGGVTVLNLCSPCFRIAHRIIKIGVGEITDKLNRWLCGEN